MKGKLTAGPGYPAGTVPAAPSVPAATSVATAQAAAGAGWFADPSGRHELRYWDGAIWTESVSDQGATSVDPA